MDWQRIRLQLLMLWHLVIMLAVVAVVSMAAFVAVARQVLPLADGWRPNLEQWLSQRVGVPVTLSAITARLDGLSIETHLSGLQLHSLDGASVLLGVPDIEIRPALWQSIRHLEPRIETTLRGLDIHLEQLPDGRIQLHELAALKSGDAEAARQAIRFVLRQPALSVVDSRVSLSLQGYPTAQFSHLALMNTNDDDVHRLAGDVRVNGGKEPLQLNISLQGDVLDWQKSQLDCWFHSPVQVLDEWLPKTQVAGLSLQKLTGGGEYWFHFNKGQLQAMEARPNWPTLVIQSPKNEIRIDHLQGDIALSRHGNQWHLAGQQLRGKINGELWPIPILAATIDSQNMSVALQHTAVDGLPALLDNFLPSSSASDWLAAAKPKGLIQALRVDLAANDAEQWVLRKLDVNAHGLSLLPTATWPGAQNISGWMVWTPEQAWLGLDTRAARLDLLQIFREPVQVQQLQGFFRLQKKSDVLQIDSSNLQVRNSDATGQAVARVLIPNDDPSAATLSLRARLRDGRVASAWRYVPWPQAGDKALTWLRESLQGGVVTQGDFLVDGPIHHREDLPLSTIQMQFSVHQGRLDYAPEWPVLRELDATVYIEGHSLSVAAKTVRLLDSSEGHGVTAVIPDLQAPILTVDGDVQSAGKDLMRLFAESPLRHTVGRVPEELSLDGVLSGHLSLAIPLEHDEGNPVVKVSATLPGNQLQIKGANLLADALSGQVSYSSQQGLQAENLQANLLGAPVTATINSRMSRGDLAEVQVGVEGRTTVAVLKQWLGGGLWQYANGAAPYQAHIVIPTNGTQSPRLQIDSSLAGMRILLPPPLGKGLEARSFNYQSPLGGQEQKAALRYGQMLTAGLDWRDGKLHGASLRLQENSTAITWPTQEGLEIEGNLASLNIRDWMPWIQQGAPSANSQTGLPPLKRLQVSTAELITDQAKLNDVKLGLSQSGDEWLLAITSTELAGAAQWSQNGNDPIQLSLSRVMWPLPASTSKSKETVQAGFSGLGARPIRIQGEGITLLTKPELGVFTLSANLLSSPSGLRVDNIILKNPLINYGGQMDWQWRGGVRSHLKGSVESSNVAGLLQAFGYAPSLVSEQATGVLDLSWQGAPDTLDIASLDGSLKLLLGEGRLLNISNTTSASRVFGWFDFENLKRRFKGDFSDITKRGLSFDKVELSGDIQAGIMAPAQLSIKGPTLKAQGQGKIDLVQQTLDQELTVIVPLTSAVPIAALVVGGPLIGGAVAAAHIALEKQIDKATQMRYHVSGSWADPKVERTTEKTISLPSETASSAPVKPAGLLPTNNTKLRK